MLYQIAINNNHISFIEKSIPKEEELASLAFFGVGSVGSFITVVLITSNHIYQIQ